MLISFNILNVPGCNNKFVNYYAHRLLSETLLLLPLELSLIEFSFLKVRPNYTEALCTSSIETKLALFGCLQHTHTHFPVVASWESCNWVLGGPVSMRGLCCDVYWAVLCIDILGKAQLCCLTLEALQHSRAKMMW